MIYYKLLKKNKHKSIDHIMKKNFFLYFKKKYNIPYILFFYICPILFMTIIIISIVILFKIHENHYNNFLTTSLTNYENTTIEKFNAVIQQQVNELQLIKKIIINTFNNTNILLLVNNMNHLLPIIALNNSISVPFIVFMNNHDIIIQNSSQFLSSEFQEVFNDVYEKLIVNVSFNVTLNDNNNTWITNNNDNKIYVLNYINDIIQYVLYVKLNISNNFMLFLFYIIDNDSMNEIISNINVKTNITYLPNICEQKNNQIINNFTNIVTYFYGNQIALGELYYDLCGCLQDYCFDIKYQLINIEYVFYLAKYISIIPLIVLMIIVLLLIYVIQNRNKYLHTLFKILNSSIKLNNEYIPISNAINLTNECICSTIDNKIIERDVSIFFADIVGYSRYGTTLSPDIILETVNIIFVAIDKLADSFNIYKIETAGDSYVAVSGYPGKNDSHEINMLNFVLSIQNKIVNLEVNQQFGKIAMRYGIHCGKVSFGMVGTKKPTIRAVGHAVNIAARLEQSSITNEIHVSEVFKQTIVNKYILININTNVSQTVFQKSKGLIEEIEFLPRGKIYFKNMGYMDTYIIKKK